MKILNDFTCSPFGKLLSLCDALKQLDETKAQKLSMFQVPFKQSLINVLKMLHGNFSGQDFFILCYWLCVIMSTLGLLEAAVEFIRVYSDEKYEPNTFWKRTYRHIPMDYQRKGRLIGSGLNITVGLLFAYGFAAFRFSYILPWIYINSGIIVCELFYWMSRFASKKVFDLKPLISIAIMLFRVALSVHVMLMVKNLA